MRNKQILLLFRIPSRKQRLEFEAGLARNREALLEGFAWDANGRRYHSIEDLHAYGARVAGSDAAGGGRRARRPHLVQRDLCPLGQRVLPGSVVRSRSHLGRRRCNSPTRSWAALSLSAMISQYFNA